MRTLLLMQGCPGAGKGHWIKENGLEPYTLSADKIRVMVENPILNEEGDFTISQKNDKLVWETLFKLLEDRMKRGDFTIIDATHNNDKLIKRYKDLCDTYKYTMFIKKIDTSLEQCLKNNKTRDAYKFVPEDKIKLMYNRIKNMKELTWYNYIDKIKEINNFYTIDMDELYNKIIVVGDIHGCIEPLNELFEKYPYDPSTAYIFLGDYIDRGLDNLAVMQKMIGLLQYNNVYFLEGNHEGILRAYSKLDVVGKKSFDEITGKELSSIPKSDIKRFYKKLRQCMRFTFGGKEYLLTHGGLPKNPKQITYISTQQLIKGVGGYDFDIDRAWFENEPNIIQIHGHRSIENSKNSWSLEGEIEFGGVLKYVEITRDNVYFGSIKNNKFKKLEDKQEEEDIKPNDYKLHTLNQDINNMSKYRFVRCKKLNNNIASLNFTESCFKKKQWNDTTIKARGLFVDRTTGKVVARGYEKFFNLNERMEVTPKYIKENYKFPLFSCNKYNGYLGIISHLNGELAFYTKSTDVSGEYAKRFKEIFYKYTNEKEREYLLKNIIEKYDCSITCEVIDTRFDPHIIEPEIDECIVLLDCIKNDLDYTPLQFVYNDMIYYCNILNEHIIEKNWNKIIEKPDELDEYIKESLQKDIEGYVIIDSNNKMFKLKTDYYNEWKSCRYLMQQIIRNNGYFEMRLSNTPLQVKFGRWFSDNYDNFANPKELNILEIRELFYNSL